MYSVCICQIFLEVNDTKTKDGSKIFTHRLCQYAYANVNVHVIPHNWRVNKNLFVEGRSSGLSQFPEIYVKPICYLIIYPKMF